MNNNRPVRRRRRRRARAEVDRQLQLIDIAYNADSDRSTDSEERNNNHESSSENDENEANENVDVNLIHDDRNDVNENSDNGDDNVIYNSEYDDNIIYNEVHDIHQNFVQSSSEDSDDSLVFNEILRENGPNLNNDEDREQYLIQSLRSWALRGVSLTKVDSLLKLLSPLHPRLPLTHSALLGTPYVNNIPEMGSGQFWYKRIATNLQQRITQDYLQNHKEIVFDINIDGFPPFKYSYDDIWPILGRLVDLNEPFIIAAYRGKGKPDYVNVYLAAYVQEARGLIENCIDLFGNNDPVRIRNYILDAQARSFIKCIIGHNGDFSCEKCEVEAVYVLNTQTYPNLRAPLRDDQSFLERRNALHHTGDSPLEQIPTAMISSFRSDPLLLVYLGVMKRWLKFVVGTTERRGILDRDQVNNLNLRVQELKEFVPRDFSRRPRPFQEKAKFRATELRRILLYDGLALFYDLPPQLWRSYTLLQAAMCILCCPSLVGREDMRNIAKISIQRFITHSLRHLGPNFPVYNVHALYHLPEECALNGTLEDFAAFVFENYLKIIKSLLRSTYKPLEQLANRDFERNGHMCEPKPHLAPGEVTLEHPQNDPEEHLAGRQFSKIQFSKTFLSVSTSDSCFRTKRGDYFVLRNIVFTHEGRVVLVGQKFMQQEDCYQYPLTSSSLGIAKLSALNADKQYVNVSDISSKCSLLPWGENEYVAIPLCHTEETF